MQAVSPQTGENFPILVITDIRNAKQIFFKVSQKHLKRQRMRVPFSVFIYVDECSQHCPFNYISDSDHQIVVTHLMQGVVNNTKHRKAANYKVTKD